MFTSILVPLDESSLSQTILPYVEYLAWVGHARLGLLHVVSKRATAGHAHSDHDPVFGEREIVASLQQAGIDATWLEGHGEPGAAIVGAAADLGADLIAMS